MSIAHNPENLSLRGLAMTLPLAALAVAALLAASGTARAADPCTQDNLNGCVELSASPAQDTVAIPPNIVLVLDDSGSMGWNFMPDSGYLSYTSSDLINPSNNRVYYDPSVTYLPPPKANGTLYPSYNNITNVARDGFGNTTTKVDLTNYSETFSHSSNKSYTCGKSTCYYRYFKFAIGNLSTQKVYNVAPASQGCQGMSNCVLDTDTSGVAAPSGVKVGENVANWFAYYHTRILMAKSGLMTAFHGLSPNYRFGFGAINNRNRDKLPKTNQYSGSYVTIAGVKPFGNGASGTQKSNFWDWLHTMTPDGSTPLRRALQSAGEYYKTSQPWTTMPGDPNYVAGATNSDELSCRASYTILTTDGFWNGGDPDGKLSGAAGSNGTEYTASDGTTKARYMAVDPFKGGGVSKGTSVADIAAYYWKNDLRDAANLVPASKRDPAFWQHMTTFTMGIGFSPVTEKDGPELPMADIFKWADDGGGSSSAFAVPLFSWPTPSSDNITNIADLAHAAVTGHGDFFSAKNPQELADGFAKAIAQIAERNVAPQPRAGNASVAVTGALTFDTGYNTGNWSGTLEARSMNPDGTTGAVQWDIGDKLQNMPLANRKVFTAVYKDVDCADPTMSKPVFDKGLDFSSANATNLDCTQVKGLETPALSGANDTRANRIDYLRGNNLHEGDLYRTRKTRLGAIINAQPTYVSFPSWGYYDNWPTNSPEALSVQASKGYSKFVTDNKDREGTVYVGANDGMLHAFSAPAPTCTQDTDDLTKINCTYSSAGGVERWAFVPRAVYANLGNLTSTDFTYRPTVDGTPRTRDVFINDKWSTLLAGGVGLGGRGVYALDITDPTKFDETKVLWEFDADMAITNACKSNSGTCKASDLGYSVPQPYIGRLHNGKWAVLVSNGYFPDCSLPDVPTAEPEQSTKPACNAIASQAPKDGAGKSYSALFVLDAETGAVVAELKTPTNIPGVSSHGLGPAVLGDYESDQIDDVAFAGDLMGNLWRFDLSSDNPSNWKVTLAYQGKTGADGKQGVQPITVMPRLFPDPWSSRFMVVFGTGKYLGVGDNSADIPVQSMYGIREIVDTSTNDFVTVKHDDLKQQKLTQEAGTGKLDGATLRKLTDDSLASTDSGWYIDFDIAATKGERVVVTPAAIFPTNAAVFQSLIPGVDNYCDPSARGAVMMVNAGNGGSNGGVSSLGFNNFVGARVSHAATGGTVPVVSKLGGGGLILPLPIEGVTPDPGATNLIELDSPVWRRRSWSVIKEAE